MGWTAGSDVTTGSLISAAQWNNYLGATGSLEYLKDALDNVTQSQPSRVFATQYQNTGGKIRIVTVTATTAGEADNITAYCGSENPVTTIVSVQDFPTSGYGTLTFVVPLSYYYKVLRALTASLYKWTEWDLL